MKNTQNLTYSSITLSSVGRSLFKKGYTFLEEMHITRHI